jgi:hypothetical protein
MSLEGRCAPYIQTWDAVLIIVETDLLRVHWRFLMPPNVYLLSLTALGLSGVFPRGLCCPHGWARYLGGSASPMRKGEEAKNFGAVRRFADWLWASWIMGLFETHFFTGVPEDAPRFGPQYRVSMRDDARNPIRRPDPAVLKIVRALARNAARRDHVRETTEADEGKSGHIRKVLDRPPRRAVDR